MLELKVIFMHRCCWYKNQIKDYLYWVCKLVNKDGELKWVLIDTINKCQVKQSNLQILKTKTHNFFKSPRIGQAPYQHKPFLNIYNNLYYPLGTMYETTHKFDQRQLKYARYIDGPTSHK